MLMTGYDIQINFMLTQDFFQAKLTNPPLSKPWPMC